MSSNTTLILLHGALGAKHQLQALAHGLEKSFDIHLLNFSGHGGSQMPEKFSIELFTEDLLQYINTNNLNDITIFGYSMGGYVAINTAQKTKRIEKIITYGTKFNWNPKGAAHEIDKLDPDKIIEKVPGFAKQLQQRHAPNDWTEVVGKTAEMMIRLGESPVLTVEELRKIDAKVTILWGSLDSMVTKDESYSASTALPNGTFEVLVDCKHPIEQVSIDLLTKKISQHV